MGNAESHNERRFFIGLNGGHQHANAMIADVQCEDGPTKLVEFRYLDPINHHYLSHPDCIRRYDKAVRFFARHFGYSYDEFSDLPHVVNLSIAGAIPHAIKGEFNVELREAFPKFDLTIVDDTWAGLFASTNAPRGICAFSGLGASVAVAIDGFDPDRKFKLDGWGPIIGDFGSGFQVTTEFFRRLGRELDRGRTPKFYKTLREFSDPEKNSESRIIRLPKELSEIQVWFDRLKDQNERDWHIKFASLCTPCLEYVDRNPADIVSQAIVRKAANDLVDTIRIAVENFSDELGELDLVCQGDMFACELYRNTVANEAELLLRNKVFASLSFATLGPSHGALKIGLAERGFDLDKYDQLPIEIIDVRRSQG